MTILAIILIILMITVYIEFYIHFINNKFVKNVRKLRDFGRVYKAEVVNINGNNVKYTFKDNSNKEHVGNSTMLFINHNIDNVNVYCDKNDLTNNCSSITVSEVENIIGMNKCLIGLCMCFAILLLYFSCGGSIY